MHPAFDIQFADTDARRFRRQSVSPPRSAASYAEIDIYVRVLIGESA